MSTEPVVNTNQETPVSQEQIEAIKALTCKKHVKIYKMNQLGLTNKEIATALSTNSGAVHNAVKNYKSDPEKVAKANSIVVGEEVKA